MVDDSVGQVKKKYFRFASKNSRFKLANGEELWPVDIAYETYGKLNNKKNNAILVFHALSGDSHAAGIYDKDDKKPGWWDWLIGPNKPLDTEKYFIICTNVIGGCSGSTGPSSVNPENGRPYGMDFPMISVSDMLKPQKKLIDELGIKKLFSIIGGSMGGMQGLQWLADFPDSVESAILLATSSSHTAQQIAFNVVGRYAIMKDPDWERGQYYSKKGPDIGLSLARMIGHITYISETAMHSRFGRRSTDKVIDDELEIEKEFDIESYLKYKGESFIKRFDANSYLYITKAIDHFELGRDIKGLSKVFKDLDSKILVISFSSDWLYPKEQSLKIVKALKYNNIDTTYCDLESDLGHDAFLISDEKLVSIIRGFVKKIEKKVRV